MASSPLNLRSSYHVRSVSLPSKSHPLIPNVEEHLCRLRSSGDTSCSSDINNLYDSVEDLLQLPLTQKTISSKRSSKLVNEVLDGSLRLLDICSSTREIFLQIKESVQDLQSVLRRKTGHGLEKDVGLYLTARKKVNKTIRKCLSDVKKAVKENEGLSLTEKDQDLVAILRVLREVESTTLSIFKSVLSSVCSSTSQKKPSWSSLSKLMHKKRVSCQEEETDIFEMEKVDLALSALTSKESSKGIEVVNVENVQKQLESVESSMRGIDHGLECIYKSVIKTRISLLNILSQ